jgi:hypothetical protein
VAQLVGALSYKGKVAGSIPDYANLLNPFSRSMELEST